MQKPIQPLHYLCLFTGVVLLFRAIPAFRHGTSALWAGRWSSSYELGYAVGELAGATMLALPMVAMVIMLARRCQFRRHRLL